MKKEGNFHILPKTSKNWKGPKSQKKRLYGVSWKQKNREKRTSKKEEKKRKKTEHTIISSHRKKLRHQNIHVMLSYAKKTTNITPKNQTSWVTQLKILLVFWKHGGKTEERAYFYRKNGVHNHLFIISRWTKRQNIHVMS